MPKKAGEDRVVMKITGVLVDMLVELDYEKYAHLVVYENGKKVLYVIVEKALYGMLQAALLWYEKFRSDLEGIGFKFNPYDPCIANRIVDGKQQTIRFHVDDVMVSHVDPNVNNKFADWLQKMYGSVGDVKVHRGKVHEYLGQNFHFLGNGKLEIEQKDYVKNLIEEFPVKMSKCDVARTPASDQAFSEGRNVKLDPSRKEIFHTTTARALYVSKRARPDIQQIVSILCTRVKDPNVGDWEKLIRMIKYLNGTRDLVLKIDTSGGVSVIKWYVDAAFAVHPDFKSHTGATMRFGDKGGAIQCSSRKQKLNTRNSCEAELVAVDDMSVLILWTKLFLEEQGYDIEKNILKQDNKASILLQLNGRKSAGKRSRALNVRYFFMTDQVQKGNVQIEYCPTDDMEGDFQTKPLQGSKFIKFRNSIMGC